MRAAVYHGRGDVRVDEREEPDAPGPGELVLEVLRASICGTDASEWAHGPILVPLYAPHPVTRHVGPLVLGHEFVGRVTATGEEVEGVAVGDRVACGAGVSCGACDWCRAGRTNLCEHYYTLGLHADGGLAELVTAPVTICRPVAASVSDDAAALAQPLAVALHALRRSAASPDERLVVIGVGGIGAFVVAAAAARGIKQITAVDVEQHRLDAARRLGATTVVDALARDPVAAILAESDGEGAHVVIEASGAPSAPATALAAARRGGRVVLVGLQAAPRELDLVSVTVREVDILTTLAHVCDVDFPEALEILARTDLAAQVLDRVIPLEALVEEGLRPLAERSVGGKVVVDPRS